MADSSQVRVAIAPETTFGVNPGSGFDFIRLTSEGLKLARGFTQSGEIDPNRQPAGQVPINKAAEGPINFEWSLVSPVDIDSPGASPRGYDLLLEGALMNDWSTIVALTNQSIDITVPGVSEQFDLDDAGLADAFTSVVQGQWIKLSGFSTNGTIYAHVITKDSANALQCEGVRADGSAVTGEAGETTVSISASMLRVGGTKKSFAIEKQFTDVEDAAEYSLYTGMRVATWQMTTSPQQILTGSFGFDGKLQDTTTSSSTGGSETAKWATPRLNAVDHVKWVMEGVYTAIVSERVAEISQNLDNQTRRDFAVGEEGPPDIGISNPTVGGNFNAFMKNANIVRKYEDQTISKIAYLLDDGTRQMMISVKRLRYTDATAAAGSNNETMQQQATYAAEADADGVSLQIDRFA